MALPTHIKLLDVAPRDGLQNEKENVATEHKAKLVSMLQDAGLKEIEVTSFVSPKWVPQMGDNAAVMAAIERRPGVRYSVLVPNLKGLEPALASKPDEILVFTAASESAPYAPIIRWYCARYCSGTLASTPCSSAKASFSCPASRASRSAWSFSNVARSPLTSLQV